MIRREAGKKKVQHHKNMKQKETVFNNTKGHNLTGHKGHKLITKGHDPQTTSNIPRFTIFHCSITLQCIKQCSHGK